MERLRDESSVLDFQTRGSPADYYILTFHGRGLWRPEPQAPVDVRDEHVVHVQLNSSYPRMMPDLSWRTPMFHPNISAGGHVCLGGYGTHWVPSVQLDELCHMLWDMIRYANFDIKSPYNREAAQWVRIQTDYIFPLDPRPLRDRVATGMIEPQDLSSYGTLKRTGSAPIQDFPVPARPVPAVSIIPAPAPASPFRVSGQHVADLIDQSNRPPTIAAPVAAPAEVTFLGDVVEGEVLAEAADDGITFLS
jgi:hypothetical protein